MRGLDNSFAFSVNNKHINNYGGVVIFKFFN